jgi:hypothetical protein
MNTIAVRTFTFNQERLQETLTKFEGFSHVCKDFIILHKMALEVFGEYIGIRAIKNKDIIDMMNVDEELQSTFKSMSASLRTSLPAKRYLPLGFGEITLSIIQGYYAYTKKETEYEIAILNKHGMISCCEFSKLSLPKSINTGDYSICANECQEDYCGSQVIGYLQFHELVQYICALAEQYVDRVVSC